MASTAVEKTSKWDADAHTALCIALTQALLSGGDSLAKHSDVLMASMKASGLDFTWEATRQHLQKLRRSANDGGTSAPSPRTPKTQATPRTPKSKANGKSSAKATTNKRKKVKSDSEDELTAETPSKKPHFAVEDDDPDDLEVKKEIVADEKSTDFGEA